MHTFTPTHTELMGERKEKLSKGVTPRIMSGRPGRLLEACQVGKDSKENRRGDRMRRYIPCVQGQVKLTRGNIQRSFLRR